MGPGAELAPGPGHRQGSRGVSQAGGQATSACAIQTLQITQVTPSIQEPCLCWGKGGLNW